MSAQSIDRGDHALHDAQMTVVVPVDFKRGRGQTNESAKPMVRASAPDPYIELRIWCEMYWDAQQHRIALENRCGVDHTGELRKNAHSDVDAFIYQPHIEAAWRAERALAADMRRSYRRVAHPAIVTWQRASLGIGEHLLARLLGIIGDPRVARPHTWVDGDPPAGHVCNPIRCKKDASRHLVALPPFERNVAKLWAYCGHGDPARKRRKGMIAEDAYALGNPRAKMLVHLLAEACMKTMASPYRRVYDEARQVYRDRAGWTDLHQHNAALRGVGKEILRDLWVAADQDIPDDQRGRETHRASVVGDPLSQRILAARQRGLSRAELARQTGLSLSAVWRAEQGRAKPVEAAKLQDVLGGPSGPRNPEAAAPSEDPT